MVRQFGTDHGPDLLIVVDKLLTGFDEPRNAVLYIDKPLKEHTLIQAIARVNRIHEHKKYGLLIDYRGILKQLDVAIKEYRELAEKTEGGYSAEDLEGLYSLVDREYLDLPKLHKRLLNIFSDVQNKKDLQQFRRVLVQKREEDSEGNIFDANQKVRDDFFEAHSDFGMCLKKALASNSIHQDPTFKNKIQLYKWDLSFFTKLREMIKKDLLEGIDVDSYEEEIVKLVDTYVLGEKVKKGGGELPLMELLEQEDEDEPPNKWDKEKLRNEAEVIKSRMTKTIQEDLLEDPFAQMRFSELLKEAIVEAEKLFDHPFKQYSLFEALEEKF